MQLYSLFILYIAQLAAAEQVLPKQAIGGVSARQLFPKAETLFMFAKRASCPLNQKACQDGCIPVTGQCCGSAGWCKLGTFCDDKLGGCCQLGKICTNGPTGGPTCDTGYAPCQNKCMPIGGDCCNDGTFCKAGTKCDGNGGCSGGTGGDGNGQCLSTETPCNNKCMPKGAVCCGNGRYCNTGYTCINAGLNCSPGGTGGNGGGDISSPAPDVTPQSSYVLTSGNGASPTVTRPGFTPSAEATTPLATGNNPSPTNAGGVTAAGTQAPTQTKGTSASHAGMLHMPSFLAAVAMALPLLLCL